MAARDAGGRMTESDWPETNLTKEVSIPVWVGAPHDILELAERIDHHFAPLRDTAVKSFDEDYRSHILLMRAPWLGRKARDEREIAKQAVIRRRTVTVELSDRENATSTNMWSAINETDMLFRRAVKVTLKGEIQNLRDESAVDTQNCTLVFSKSGNSLQMQGPGPWVREALADITALINEKRPGWWFVRQPWLIGLTAALVFGAAIFLTVHFADRLSGVLFFLSFIGAYIVPGLLAWTVVALFPKFELRYSDRGNLRQRILRVTLGGLAILVSLTGIISSIVTIVRH
jgi:hypothetical protein